MYIIKFIFLILFSRIVLDALSREIALRKSKQNENIINSRPESRSVDIIINKFTLMRYD